MQIISCRSTQGNRQVFQEDWCKRRCVLLNWLNSYISRTSKLGMKNTEAASKENETYFCKFTSEVGHKTSTNT